MLKGKLFVETRKMQPAHSKRIALEQRMTKKERAPAARKRRLHLPSQAKVHALTRTLFGGGQHRARVKFTTLPVNH